MEKQSQQPLEQKQSSNPLLKKALANSKLPLAAALIATILAVGGILLLRGMSPGQTEQPQPRRDEQMVSEYLNEHIDELVEAQPVLGAPQFFIYDKVKFYEGNKFIAPFEDGHIGGYLLGQYSIENGEVQITHIDETLREETLDDLKKKHGFDDIDTSTWKTYRNDEFGYEIKYPADWEVTSPFTEKTPAAVRFAKLIENEGDAAFDIIVEPNPSKKPATKEWYLDWVKTIPAGIDTSKYIFETMDFHGYQAVKANSAELFFAKDTYMFRIRFNVSIYDPDLGFADYAKPILDQILSTFRFMD